MSDFAVFFDTGNLPQEKLSELEKYLPRDVALRIKDTKNDRERRLRTGAYFALDILFRHLYCRSMPDIRRNESGKPYFVKGESSSFDCEKVDCAASFSPEKSDCSASALNSSLSLGNGSASDREKTLNSEVASVGERTLNGKVTSVGVRTLNGEAAFDGGADLENDFTAKQEVSDNFSARERGLTSESGSVLGSDSASVSCSVRKRGSASGATLVSEGGWARERGSVLESGSASVNGSAVGGGLYLGDSADMSNDLNLGGDGILPSFSISHSGDIAAVIISTDGRDIGIDIEGSSAEKSADRAAAKFLGRFEKFSNELKRSYERGSFTGELCDSFPYNHSGSTETANSEIEKSCTAGSSVIGSFAHTEQKLSDKSSVLCEYVKADSDRDRETQALNSGVDISFFVLRQEGSEFELYPCQLKRLFYPDFEDSNLVKWTVLEALLKMSGGGFCDLGKLENSLKRASLATFKLSAGDEFTVSVAKAEN